jgi:hypothetical protein
MPAGWVAGAAVVGSALLNDYQAGKAEDRANAASAASAAHQREYNQIEYDQTMHSLFQEEETSLSNMQGTYAAGGVSIDQGSPIISALEQESEFDRDRLFLGKQKESKDKGVYIDKMIADTRASNARDAVRAQSIGQIASAGAGFYAAGVGGAATIDNPKYWGS